nr:class II aldolase/adducin family protein [Streptomyces sp. Rer75]
MSPYDDESAARAALVRTARSLFTRGLTHGSTGNLSVRLTDGSLLLTPTGSSLGTVTEDTLSRTDVRGTALDGPRPTKEAFLHAAFYRARRTPTPSSTCTPPTRQPSPAWPTSTPRTRCRR